MSLNFLIIIFKKLFKLRSNLYLKLIIWKTKELMFESDIAQNIQAQIPGFIAKTYQILISQEFSKIIFWTPTGKEFAIKDINKFQEIVLPLFFRHRKINSFVRQLNMYGFHKSRRDTAKNVFSHPKFLKERIDLLKQIKRKTKTKKECDCNSLKNLSDEEPEELQRQQEITPMKKIQTQAGIPEMVDCLENEKFPSPGLNLNVTLKRMSLNDFANIEFLENQHQDSISLGDNLEQNDEQERDRQEWKKQVMNPSCFFSSFVEKN